jgi:hypothetical protein
MDSANAGQPIDPRVLDKEAQDAWNALEHAVQIAPRVWTPYGSFSIADGNLGSSKSYHSCQVEFDNDGTVSIRSQDRDGNRENGLSFGIEDPIHVESDSSHVDIEGTHPWGQDGDPTDYPGRESLVVHMTNGVPMSVFIRRHTGDNFFGIGTDSVAETCVIGRN